MKKKNLTNTNRLEIHILPTRFNHSSRFSFAVINGEKAAFNTPVFAQKRQRTLDMLIRNLYQDHMPENSKVRCWGFVAAKNTDFISTLQKKVIGFVAEADLPALPIAPVSEDKRWQHLSRNLSP